MLDPKEKARRDAARYETTRILRRAKRLCAGLNRAIRLGDPDRVIVWQKLMLPFYGIPYCDWVVSQVTKGGGRVEKSS